MQLTKTVSEFKSKTIRTVGPKVSAQLAMKLNDPKTDTIEITDTDEDDQEIA